MNYVKSHSQKLRNREARCLHRLGENDRIPRLYAHFVEDEQFYLAQEYIEGNNLSDEIIVGKPLTEEQTIKLLYEILSALTILYQINIIHRDLKPQNIRRHQKNGKIVLIDFGAIK
ncbi:MAG: protein kinase [Cyanobacteriota bacterium]|nr:protein kinase [Cyanobacteriota bacterium]